MNQEPNDDLKVFDVAGNDLTQRVPLNICSVHSKETWMQGSFVDNHDGTVTCKFCPQGYRLPGYTRCIDGKIVDLRILNGASTDSAETAEVSLTA